MHLMPPSSEYKASFIEAVREFHADTMNTAPVLQYKNLSIPELEADFDAYVHTQRGYARGENLPKGFVPATILWLVDDGEYIGRVSIRHELIEALRAMGGHIGYDIRPSKRNRGYGSKILELALPIARSLGMARVLLACDETNTGSRKIIEKNGGVLENRVENPETGVPKLRYWIDQ